MISVQSSSGFRVMIAAALVLALPFAAMAAPTPADECEASKNKTAGEYYSCREKAEATAITKALPADYSKCTAKFDDKWDKAETTGAGACPDTVLTAPMNALIAAQAADAALVIAGAPIPVCGRLPATGQTMAYGTGSDGDVQAGVARSFTDNGDGTITDNATGLMWEKKSDNDDIHDKDNAYSWSTGTNNIDGTISTTFLATLNGGGGFAGHTDWRVPNFVELQSLRSLEVENPSTYSAFNTGCVATCTVTTCSCTRTDYYWSSSTYQSDPIYAGIVNFFSGEMAYSFKTSGGYYVRAVRAGS